MNSKGTILVADDEESVRAMLGLVLRSEGYEVLEAEDGDIGVDLALARQPDLVLMDVRMPRMDGLSAYRKLRGRWRGVFILMTAFATVGDAVEAMKAGVSDYIIKPFNIDELKTLIARSLHNMQLGKECAPGPESSVPHLLNTATNRSPAIQASLFEAARAAPTDATVLITGESGTGKEVFADYIHFHSARADGPFIKMNCGALSESLLDSELFGHEKGAFTSAANRRLGRFERADKGTLFLDEIGEMPQPLQVKLLRVLQEREFERLGGSELIRTDTRIIAATNRPPEELVNSGLLRQDLYYRLAVVVLDLPPLRRRQEDIIPLARLFMQRFAKSCAKPMDGIAPESADALARYTWPGNIRELSNVIERAVIMTEGRSLRLESLPAHVANAPLPGLCGGQPQAFVSGQSLRDTLKATEREMLAEALARNKGNRAKTSRDLGMSRRALQYKIEEYGLGADKE